MVPFSLPSPSRVYHTLSRKAFSSIHTFIFSFKSIFALGFFTASATALIAHKFTIILLHYPLPILQLIFYGPFLSAFDIITLIFLRLGLISSILPCQFLTLLFSILIITCSATFVSLYVEATAELNWGRSIEVLSSSTTS
jgi:hypothetical protein